MSLRSYQQEALDKLREMAMRHKIVILTARQGRTMGGSLTPTEPDKVGQPRHLGMRPHGESAP
jgi:hypothetical protein